MARYRIKKASEKFRKYFRSAHYILLQGEIVGDIPFSLKYAIKAKQRLIQQDKERANRQKRIERAVALFAKEHPNQPFVFDVRTIQ